MKIDLEKLEIEDYLRMDHKQIDEVRQELVARIKACKQLAELTKDGVSSLSNDAKKEARAYQAGLRALNTYIANRFGQVA